MGIFFIFLFLSFLCFINLSVDFFFIISFCFLFLISLGFNLDLYIFSLNILSWSLLILSVFIISLIFLRNLSFCIDKKEGMYFSFNLILIFVALFLVFSSSNILIFYIFFEFSIIPIFFLLCGWGFNFERFQARFYILIYTLFFSLPFLIFIFLIFYDEKSIRFYVSSFFYFSNFDVFFIFISIFIFLVKLPSFFFHIWLPKAHVEAPVSGSIILAGLLLKLGAYGLLIYIPFIFYNSLLFSSYFFILGLWGGILASFICFRQVDLKKIVAFISVCHIGMVLSNIFTFYLISLIGLIFILLSHGLSSSGIFYSLNCFYERIYSRRLILVKGGNIYILSIRLWFFLLICCNISAPPTLNFISELIILFGVSLYNIFSLIMFSFIMFIGTVCSIHIYVSIFHGFFRSNHSFTSLNLKEHIILIFHCLPIFIIFLFF